MTTSLANKYRPQDFDHLIGQEHIAHILQYQVKHQSRQANYLFFGPRGTGKTSTARIFAKAINCLNSHDGNPCNQCSHCQAIDNNATLDIMEIDAASHTGVDNIREEIIDKVGYRPMMLRKKIIIIDEVHMLSKGAFNALLKTMEEPTEWMVFILATTELNKVPETIVSRCQVFNFKKVENTLLVDNLRMIAKQEGIHASDEGLHMIARLSDGCVRDANKYLDQISIMGEVTADLVGQFLGVVSDQMIADLLTTIRHYQQSGEQHHRDNLVSEIEHIAKKGVDLTTFPKQLMQYADEHFADDPVFYSKISTLASDLLSQSRWYPHPQLLYKTILFTLGDHLSSSLSEASSSPDSISHKHNPTTVTHEDNHDKGEAEVLQEIQEQLPIQAKATNREETVNITEKFVQLLPSSLQKILYDACEFDTISDHEALLIVLNPMAKMALDKKENQDIMTQALHQLGLSNIQKVILKPMTKEEYMMMKL